MTNPHSKMKRHAGISLVGLLMIMSMLGLALLFAFKLVPVYLDYFAVKKTFSAMASAGEFKSGSVAEIRNAFARRVSIDNVNSVSAEDLDITKDNGETVVSVAWAQKVPLFTGWTLVIDFSASSTDR